MSLVHLAEGDILWKDELMFRVLYLQREEVVVFNMSAPLVRRKSKNAEQADLAPAMPEFWPYEDVLGQKLNKKAERTNILPFPIDAKHLTEAEKSFKARALPVIQFLGPQEPFIYYADTRARLIAKAIERYGYSRQTITKYMRSYWKNGKNEAAVISEYGRCGARGVIRIAGKKKRGRPRSPVRANAMGEGVNVAPGDQGNIKRAVAWYRNNKEKTFEDAYLWMLGMMYGERVTSPDGRTSMVTDLRNAMTFEQFNYHGSRTFTEAERARREAELAKGSRGERRRFSGKLASDPEVGEIAETDALRTNVSLVSSEDRAVVLGAAIVFLVIDYASGIIMGVSLGWDGENYETFVDALVNCVADKQALCAEHGIKIETNQWPVSYLAQNLHADKGSATIGSLSNRVAAAMAPNPFANTPAYSPETKGSVENTVKLIKMLIRRKLRGAWVGKIDRRPRGTTSPHKLAAHTRPEFMKLLLEIILEVNARVRKRAAVRTDLVTRGIANCPRLIVQDALDTNRHRFRRLEPVELQKALLPRVPCTVTDKGISVGDELYYVPALASDLSSEWYQRLERKNRDYKNKSKNEDKDEDKVEVARDRRTVDIVFLCPPGRRDLFVPCILTDRSKKFRGKSLSEVQDLRRRNNELNSIEHHRQLPETVARDRAISATVQYALAETRRATGNVPPSQRDTGNRRVNRAVEKAAEREKLNQQLATLASSPQSPAPNTDTEQSDNFGYPDMDDL